MRARRSLAELFSALSGEMSMRGMSKRARNGAPSAQLVLPNVKIDPNATVNVQAGCLYNLMLTSRESRGFMKASLETKLSAGIRKLAGQHAMSVQEQIEVTLEGILLRHVKKPRRSAKRNFASARKSA